MAETECAKTPQPFGIFRCDGALRLQHINGDFANWLGCDSNELIETGWRAFLFGPPTDTLSRFEQDASEGKSGVYDLPFLSRDGQRLYVAVHTYAVHTTHGVMIWGRLRLLAWDSPRTHVIFSGRRSFDLRAAIRLGLHLFRFMPDRRRYQRRLVPNVFRPSIHKGVLTWFVALWSF